MNADVTRTAELKLAKYFDLVGVVSTGVRIAARSDQSTLALDVGSKHISNSGY